MTVTYRSKEDAEAVFKDLFPDAKVRRTACKLLSAFINEADRQAPSNWGTTLHGDFPVVMNMGGGAGAVPYVLAFETGWISVVVQDLALLSTEEQNALEVCCISEPSPIKHWPERRLPNRYRFRIGPTGLQQVDDILVRHLPALLSTQVQSMSKGTMHKRCRDAHTPGIIRYLDEVLDTSLPSPTYVQLGVSTGKQGLFNGTADGNKVKVPGAPYRPGARHSQLESCQSQILLNRDPKKAERALASHSDTQDGIAALLREKGHEPLSPSGEPDFDIGWLRDDVLTVVEVKSLSDVNEIMQLRLGLGQVLHYRTLLKGPHGPVRVRAVLAVEREPRDPEWTQVCRDADVTLTWGPCFEGLLDGPR